MAVSLPYLASYKNVGTLFEKIGAAAVPPKFTHDFLQTTIGLKSTSDRSLITLLRHLGFVDQSGTPTSEYSLLKNKDKQRTAIAAGIKRAYGPLFNADENVHNLTGDKLRSLISQVAGTDSDMSARIANTFAALVRQADFNADAASETIKIKPKEDEEIEDADDDADETPKKKLKGLRTEFHYNIQVQLPSNGTEETYLNIFNAIRKTFQ